MTTILDLAPQAVWKHFYALTQIPRPSGHVEKVSEYLVNWAKDLGLEAFIDNAGNVVMRKAATPGWEDHKMVTLQAHMDMVPQKLVDVAHDFTKDPIQTEVDGEWVHAKGTTLGADDGMGVAAIMAVMESEDIKHGPLEALITKDEETGMFGAFALSPDTLKGDILLNLDSETEGELYIGCAGGVDVISKLEYKEEPASEGFVGRKITLKGLRGGHSGIEIDQGRANAVKLMARITHDLLLEFDCQLVSLVGGNMRNAIPRDAEVVLNFNPEDIADLDAYIAEYEAQIASEYKSIESGMLLKAEEVAASATVVPEEIQDNLINALMACQDGVTRMIPTVPDTVETSSNLGIVTIGNGNARFQILARSSCDTMKDWLADSLTATFNMAGMKTTLHGEYSGWQPNVESPILAALKKVYKEKFGNEPKVKVVHAGLECGIIGANYPKLDMVSFGPTLESPHTPSERVHIESVEKFYNLIAAVLEQI